MRLSDQDNNENKPLLTRPKVVCDFGGGYAPPFDVARTVEKMLDSVPPKLLNGLGEVVLTNTAGLPRKLRRNVTKSRGRKVKQAAALGIYHEEWNNQPAWIQIYLDNTLKTAGINFLLRFPTYRAQVLGEVLFHEIGHHIHKAVRPEFREREDVADVWKVRLGRSYARQNFPVLRMFLKTFRFLLRPLLDWGLRRGLQKGMISKAEFEERRNPYHRRSGSRLE